MDTRVPEAHQGKRLEQWRTGKQNYPHAGVNLKFANHQEREKKKTMWELQYQPYVSSLQTWSSSWSSQAEIDANVWKSHRNIIDKKRDRKWILNPHRLCGNLFMMSCSIRLNVSKKSTASSIPSDMGEEAARLYAIPWLWGKSVVTQTDNLTLQTKNHCDQLLPLFGVVEIASILLRVKVSFSH